MPEGPEVKITADQLDFLFCNAKLLKVSVLGGKFLKTPPSGLNELKLPLTFSDVKSKGKMLIFSFQDSSVRMFAGLGMTGQFTLQKSMHSHLQFDLDIPSPFPSTIYYTDPRRFGNVNFSFIDLSSKLAPSFFDIEEKDLLERANKIKTNRDILSVLLDQEKLISGIGNYLVAEILYACKISPFRLFKNITTDELSLICKESKRIGLLSYQEQGLSIRDYKSPEGEDGKFKSFLQVYSQTKTSNDELVIGEKGSHGRTIWWVPSIQK